MSKYRPLKEFLVENGQENVPMTFTEIEKVLNFRLPASKKYPAWWSNNPSNNTMTREWLDAGYETESVNTATGTLVFRRVRKNRAAGIENAAALQPNPSLLEGRYDHGAGFMEARAEFNRAVEMQNGNVTQGEEIELIVPPLGADPLFGCMAGTLTLLPDVDYTAPADPDWGKVYDD